MQPVYYHIDVNSAFLSWEASYRINILGEKLDLRTIPSAVGGNQASRHGIVLAKSLPCKKYGIQTGEPLVSARSKCPQLVVVPPNYDMYAEASNALMSLLREYSSDIYQYSIDESFVNMTGTSTLFGSPVVTAELIKNRIKNELGFTVNIGVSSNKLLAKMASDFKKPDRVHTLFLDEIKEKMWPLPIGNLFFVGHATEAKLHSFGINTIGELAQCDPNWLKKVFKSHGELIWQFANGIDEQMDKVTVSPINNKGYGNSTTLSYNVNDSETAKLILLSLTEMVCSRIRADHAFISVVSISILDQDFNYSGRQRNLISPTDITRQIYEAVCVLFDEVWDHKPIRQLGVHTSNATCGAMYQYSLFDTYNIDKEMKLDKAIDEIRSTWGKEAVIRGSFINSRSKGILPMTGGHNFFKP